MISGDDFYKVMCSMVPLYFAMLVAYASVKWWNIFTPEQCSGINRFVAVFAVPILSFHFISQNNPYQMDTKFILADTLSKILVLLFLSLWTIFSSSSSTTSSRRQGGGGGGGLDWLITLFSVSTLPNTLVMGIPLLKSMYGEFTQSLMVQIVVLQCIIWYTLLLVLFEYRAATLLIRDQFPGSTAAAITKFEIDGDVISLDGRDPLTAESQLHGDGRIRVRIRRSTSSAPDSAALSLSSSSFAITPRASNLSGAEIYSVGTPPPMRPHEFNHAIANANASASASADLFFGYRAAAAGSPCGPPSGYASSDAYSLQPTPRASNFNELDTTTVTTTANTPTWIRSPVGSGKVFGHHHHHHHHQHYNNNNNKPGFSVVNLKMAWESPGICQQGGNDGGGERQGCKDVGPVLGEKDLSFRNNSKFSGTEDADSKPVEEANQEMPRALVMVRLILIMVGRKLSRNPNTYSSIFGLLWSLISFKWGVGMPNLVKYSIKIISDAGLGMAMFSLGLFMALQPSIIACGTKMATIGMAIRFLSGPILMSAASVAVGLRGIKLHAAIVQAALPQGIVPFVFAREYGLHPDILSTGVIFGMLVSLPVTLLYYILLGL